MKKNNGITLIALAITIVILVILVGVTIAALSGDNGLLLKASESKEKTAKTVAKEKVQIEVSASFDNNGNLNMGLLNKNLENIQGIQGLQITKFPATVKVDGYSLVIDDKGNVALEEKYEFENGTIEGTGTVKTDSTASGGKYMYLMSKEDVITLEVNVEKAGAYGIKICYNANYGNKVQRLKINDIYQTNISLIQPNWTEMYCGTYKFNKGKNKIQIVADWGWANFDYLTIYESNLPAMITASQTTPCNVNATKETKSLMKYLSSIYGKNILSGQQEINRGGHGGNYEYEFDYIKNLTGKLPAVRSFDYLSCNPASGYPDHNTNDGTTDRIINWVKNNNGIAASCWHLVVPKDFENYTIGERAKETTYNAKQTTFDTSKAIIEGTKEYEYYQLCLKNLATELKILQNNNVPLIFRPLHEAEGTGGEEGAWFWWGKAGSEVYKKLWILTYKTLTEKYGLNNIIWEWNSYNYENSEDWYPGDSYVDIIAFDKYSCKKDPKDETKYIHDDSPMSGTFYSIMKKYNSKKMIAISENDSFSTVDKLINEKAGWLCFSTWYDSDSKQKFLTDPSFNTKEDTIEMYNSEYCITLDELPPDLYTSK